jgi:hypothetical protein
MITFVVPTTGRPSLQQALDSIECWPGDEILVVGRLGAVVDPRVRLLPCDPFGDWGHGERNYAQAFSHGRYLANLDDDDVYVPGHRAIMADAIAKTPDQPIIFRMRYPNGMTLWHRPYLLVEGNVGTPMMFFPNDRLKLGRWGHSYTGDAAFLASCAWRPDEYVWRGEVIALIGRDQNSEAT